MCAYVCLVTYIIVELAMLFVQLAEFMSDNLDPNWCQCMTRGDSNKADAVVVQRYAEPECTSAVCVALQQTVKRNTTISLARSGARPH